MRTESGSMPAAVDRLQEFEGVSAADPFRPILIVIRRSHTPRRKTRHVIHWQCPPEPLRTY